MAGASAPLILVSGVATRRQMFDVPTVPGVKTPGYHHRTAPRSLSLPNIRPLRKLVSRHGPMLPVIVLLHFGDKLQAHPFRSAGHDAVRFRAQVKTFHPRIGLSGGRI